MNTEYKIWMVWVDGGSAPNKAHFSKQEASQEAVRLAGKTGHRTYLLESVGYYMTPKPQVAFVKTNEVAPEEA